MSTRRSKPLVVQFLVPTHDRAGRRYPQAVNARLERDLGELCDGWSLVEREPLPGAWRNPATGKIECDTSWRYEVAIPRRKLAKLDAFLGDLGHRLGQAAMYRVVYAEGSVRIIPARPLKQP